MDGRVFEDEIGIVDRSGRGKLRFTGEQALWFCDQLLSNRLVDLAPGSGAEALLLTPHGRITTLLRLLYVGGEVLADFEDPTGETAGVLARFFGGRVFATRVTIAEASAEVGIISLLGPRVEAIVSGVLDVSPGTMPGEEEHAATKANGIVLARVVRPARGLDLLLARGDVPRMIAALEAAGGRVAPDEAYEDLRVRSGLVRDRVDFDEGYLPQEAALERAVHFSKGCYLGQEAVAMTQRGRVKRRIRHLRFEGDARLGPVTYGGEEVGAVTSITAPGAEAPGYGIATVRTSVGLGERVGIGTMEEAAAVLEELPGTVAGPRLPSARELRESLRP